MMEAASTSETSADFYQITRRKNPEDSHLRTWKGYQPKIKDKNCDVLADSRNILNTSKNAHGINYAEVQIAIEGFKRDKKPPINTIPAHFGGLL
jgi:hypothetical protein